MFYDPGRLVNRAVSRRNTRDANCEKSSVLATPGTAGGMAGESNANVVRPISKRGVRGSSPEKKIIIFHAS